MKTDQNRSLSSHSKEKIENFFKFSKGSKEELIDFLSEDENARYVYVLNSITHNNEAFQWILKRLVNKIRNRTKTSDSSASEKSCSDSKTQRKEKKTFQFYSCGNLNWINKEIKLFAETATRISLKVGFTIIGTALLPGIGTLLGVIFGGVAAASLRRGVTLGDMEDRREAGESNNFRIKINLNHKCDK